MIFFRNIIEFVTKIINFFATVPNFMHTKKKTGPLPLCFNLKHCGLCFFFVLKLLVNLNGNCNNFLDCFLSCCSLVVGFGPLILYPASILIPPGAHVCVHRYCHDGIVLELFVLNKFSLVTGQGGKHIEWYHGNRMEVNISNLPSSNVDNFTYMWKQIV